jgi:hypothetical protein
VSVSCTAGCPLWLRVQIAEKVWPEATSFGHVLNQAAVVAAVLDGDDNVPVTRAERAAIVLAYVEEGSKERPA